MGLRWDCDEDPDGPSDGTTDICSLAPLCRRHGAGGYNKNKNIVFAVMGPIRIPPTKPFNTLQTVTNGNEN